MAYYDGTKLLNMKDINGEKPEIFICTSNRSAGKTVFFNKLVFQRFLDTGEKFCLIYRYIIDMSDIAEQFFGEIGRLFYPQYNVQSKPVSNGIYHTILCDSEVCGYAVALNCADKIKRHSHRLADATSMLFDEFQTESGMYAANEVAKFKSLHVSIARGGGEQAKYLPVYMLSNPVSIINPYYVELGIADRLQTDTKFLRGNGWVMEQGYNKSAAKAQQESAFNKAFNNTEYMAYSTQGKYLLDNQTFVQKLKGKNSYIATIAYKGVEYGIRRYPEEGVIYCSKSVDKSAPNRIAVTTSDHNINYVMLSQNKLFIQAMRYYFDYGCFRFADIQCREAIIKLLSY